MNTEKEPVLYNKQQSIAEYLQEHKDDKKIIFSYLMDDLKPTDQDYIDIVQRAIKQLADVPNLQAMDVRLETSLISLADSTNWALDLDNCSNGSICIKYPQNPGFKMEIPIKSVTGIVIEKR